MTAGDSSCRQAERRAAAADALRRRAERLDRAASAWQLGADGEDRLATAMSELSAEGHHRLDDRAVPGTRANIDHVLIGPRGVFMIDAKNWSGSLAFSGRRLMRDGRSVDRDVETVRFLASRVGHVLDCAGLGHRPPVVPVLAFVGQAQVPGAVFSADRVVFANLDQLVPFVRSRPILLDTAGVESVLATLVAAFPPKTSGRAPGPTAPNGTRSSSDDGASLAARPPEQVVFLDPWRRHGHHRLYVKDATGAQIGFLDLRSGEVSSTSDSDRPLLAQLLPAFCGAGSDQELSEEAGGVFRRFVDSLLGRRRESRPPVIAVRIWKKPGVVRLYVSRVDARGVKSALGDIDEASGRISVGLPHELGQYCLQQYRVLRRPSGG